MTIKSRGMQPMLAAKISIEELDGLRYPLMASPKIDGIRVLIHPDLGPVTRTLKPVRNRFVRDQLSALPAGVDGEVVCSSPTHPRAMNLATRGVMRSDGEPRFRFHAFDWVGPEGFRERHARLADLPRDGFVRVVAHTFVFGPRAARAFESARVASGYEGIMLRDPGGAYKYGRSTAAEQGLLKLKRFEDAEAEVVGVKELHSNANELQRDERGYAKRSSHKSGKVPMGVLGALVCRAEGFSELFDVGTGFTALERERLWSRRQSLVGRVIKFKFQAAGMMDAPRFPTFLGIRED